MIPIRKRTESPTDPAKVVRIPNPLDDGHLTLDVDLGEKAKKETGRERAGGKTDEQCHYRHDKFLLEILNPETPETQSHA